MVSLKFKRNLVTGLIWATALLVGLLTNLSTRQLGLSIIDSKLLVLPFGAFIFSGAAIIGYMLMKGKIV